MVESGVGLWPQSVDPRSLWTGHKMWMLISLQTSLGRQDLLSQAVASNTELRGSAIHPETGSP